ncbi:adenylyltransferase/cytidyltransferase family protein [Niallia sp. Krafla_26]|uniref:adenylyltransferase/cytidyltransferase family protein n=1 Tax=Niallia sp. Krafla_26 TaxID=3064703 RepID=UPI003D17192B
METITVTRENLSLLQENAIPKVMALGFFDGLHNGHREVIKQALNEANKKKLPLAVMSFFPHPKTVICNGKKQIHYLMPPAEKEKMLAQLGVDFFYSVTFDREFASLSPEQFVKDYLIDLGVTHAVAGFDFSYGYKGIGNMDTLNEDSGGLIDVTKVQKVECQGEKISSTCIRERLLQGKIEEIPDFLGRPYEVMCNYDGYRLVLSPYYTLPAPGRYRVTLKKGFHSCETVLDVTETTLKGKIPAYLKGTLSICWMQKMEEQWEPTTVGSSI